MDEEDEEKHSGEKEKNTEKANWGKILLSIDERARTEKARQKRALIKSRPTDSALPLAGCMSKRNFCFIF